MTILNDLQSYLSKHPLLKQYRISLMFNVIFAIMAIAVGIYPQSAYTTYDLLLGIAVLFLIYVEKPSFSKPKGK